MRNSHLNSAGKNIAYAVVFFGLVFIAPTIAVGHLGGFEPSDGYILPPTPGAPAAPWNDVVYYNAGDFGANGGGGSFAAIPYNSSLWKLNSEVGGYFPNSATRNAAVLGAPPYLPPPAGSTIPSYIVGNHPGGRTGTCLALRNQSNGPIGPIEYDYTLDSIDFGGLTPATVTSGVVMLRFYFCPNPVNPSNEEKFIMSFVDASGIVGLQLGYTRANEVLWRQGSAGAWTFTGIIADDQQYDGFEVLINLSNDTFEIRFLDFSTSSTLILTAAGTPLGSPMSNFTNIGWWLNDEVTGGTGGKNLFDDFGFQIESEICVEEPTLLDDLINENLSICSGEKTFCEFSYSPIGDMPPATDILVIPIEGGIRFQGAFVDLPGFGASDALIEFKVKAPEGFVVSSAQLAANPLVIGDGFFVVTETFLPTDTQTILSVYDIQPGGVSQLLDESDLSTPTHVLCVQKDVIAWATTEESLAVMSFIDQKFVCEPEFLKGDVNCDGVIDFLDIDPFVQKLSLGEYCPKADINCDGVVDFLDVQPFVDLLSRG